MFGRMRLNHLVLEVRDLKRWQAFAGDFLGLPLFDMPVRKRLQHFMLETNDLTDVGMVWERAKRLGIPITLDLG